MFEPAYAEHGSRQEDGSVEILPLPLVGRPRFFRTTAFATTLYYAATEPQRARSAGIADGRIEHRVERSRTSDSFKLAQGIMAKAAADGLGNFQPVAFQVFEPLLANLA